MQYRTVLLGTEELILPSAFSAICWSTLHVEKVEETTVDATYHYVLGQYEYVLDQYWRRSLFSLSNAILARRKTPRVNER
jgi:hypothetical protein